MKIEKNIGHRTSDIGLLPRQLGFHFPAEFAPQRAMWLSWIHKEASWPGKIETVYKPYCEFIHLVAQHQKVCINVADESMKEFALKKLNEFHPTSNLQPPTSDIGHPTSNFPNIEFYFHPTNDAWCRDHGPAFVVRSPKSEVRSKTSDIAHPTSDTRHRTSDLPPKAIIDWGYNAWGNKYPPYDLDDVIPTLIGEKLGLKVFHPGIVMEGGSVEFNGKGTLLTTTSCLLNPNRNPHLSQKEIEQYLIDYYGVENVLWLGDGIVGDDTDGHIDDITRFVNETTVVTVIEHHKADENYKPLQENLKLLQTMRLENGKQLNIIELPMPHAVVYEGQRLPASYANFYISNNYVIVPTFRDAVNDDKALDILQSCFTTRKVVGIDSTDLIWGLGSFHCLSQQEPMV